MKKLVVYLIVMACIGSLWGIKVPENPLFSFDKVEKVCFVSSEKSENCEFIVCGDAFFNYCSADIANKKLEEIKEAESFQFYLDGVGLKEVFDILKFQEVSVSQVDGLTVYCGFSVYGNKSVYVDGKKVNVQIVAVGDKIIAGFPMILTGY